MKNIIKNEKPYFWAKLCTEYGKNVGDKIVYLKKIYKFTANYFLMRHVVFILIMKNVIKNEKIRYTPNLCAIWKNDNK